MTSDDRFRRAVERFDAANAEDPNRERADGVEQPKELVYARRMTARLDRFRPDAPEPVRLAARCQHIRRWTIPRTDYAAGREGYRRWRTDLARFHADTAAAILRDVGYGDDVVARVGSLLRKERLKADPDVQLLEDVICLVFIEHYLAGFAPKHDEETLARGAPQDVAEDVGGRARRRPRPRLARERARHSPRARWRHRPSDTGPSLLGMPRPRSAHHRRTCRRRGHREAPLVGGGVPHAVCGRDRRRVPR